MSKFKVGDKVKLKSGICCINLNHIDTYTVRKSYEDALELDGIKYSYAEHIFMLVEHSNEVVDTSNILTPLQAVEAILNEDKLQVYDSDCDKWYTFACGHRNITIEDLKHIKLRLKPKTIVINGVEVVAPTNKDDIEQYFYTVNFSENIVHTIDKVYIDRGFKYYWAKKEDAQKALDAMLIPFNELNRGEQQ